MERLDFGLQTRLIHMLYTVTTYHKKKGGTVEKKINHISNYITDMQNMMIFNLQVLHLPDQIWHYVIQCMAFVISVNTKQPPNV